MTSLASDQNARGWRVTVAGPPLESLVEAIQAGGAEHIGWSAERSPGPGVVPESRRLSRIVQRVDPDVVHLHSSKAGLAGRLAVRGRRPTVFQPHAWSFEAADGVLASGALFWERLAARWTDVLLCVSEAERERGGAVGINGNAQVVVNGIDLEIFTPAGPAERLEARRRLGLPDAPLAVCVGRLTFQKGQDVLLDAWSRVKASANDPELVFVGDGPERQALAERAGPGVVLVGEREDVPDWLAAADLVVFPSRWEGMSLAMLEAMARARCVVATSVDGAHEALGDDAGAIVPVNDPKALADAILERLANPDRADREGLAGRRRAERSHDLRQATEAVARIYTELFHRVAKS
jgi:glycosyltransferase involved in cell wall biosynthesis